MRTRNWGSVALVVIVGLMLSIAGAASAGAASGPTAHSAKKKCHKKKYRHGQVLRVKVKCKSKTTQPINGANGSNGSNGAPGSGTPGDPGPPGAPAAVKVTSLPGLGFDVTNGSCSLTPDGVECGNYADGGAAGGSIYYEGFNGEPLSVIKSLIYNTRYTADNDTGGVGVPYLRVFLNGDADDAIFSPNTQPPNPDIAQGPFHTYAATSGVWRYDDDGGSGGAGTYGVNGAPYSTLQGDHGTETISGIYISTGFSSGVNLNSLTRYLAVNGTTYTFGS